MGQNEVFEWLRDQREIGNDQYFLPKEISIGLKSKGFSNGVLNNIRGDCFCLWQCGNGCLEMYDYDLKGRTNWLKGFRIKKDYVRGAK
jgi:hypothetical protein